MTSPQTDITTQLPELSGDSFEAFCNDISGMFGVEMASQALPITDKSLKTLGKEYKKLSAVITVHARGVLDGDFHILVDKEGLFTLAGTIVMLPEERIQANRKTGSVKEAQELQDAVGETGNLLVGSWDRIFREDLEGHIHFLQTGTFIGNAWEDAECPLILNDNEEFLYFPFDLTVGSFPPFKCGVIFPEAVYSEKSDANPEVDEQEKSDPESTAEQAETATASEKQTPPTEEDPPPAADIAEETPADNTAAAQEEEEEAVEETVDETVEEAVEDEPAPTSSHEDPADESKASAPIPEQPAESASIPDTGGAVSQAIHKMVQSLPIIPHEHAQALLGMTAKEIMQKDVLWGKPEDSVEHAMQSMQQADATCMLVGDQKSLVGIITWIDIAEAVSVYLRPVFAKWHRPLDDATLQIRIKIIMARPVRTVNPETTLAYIMEDMCQHRLRCLPVMNEQGIVEGIVTAFDVFRILLQLTTD